MVASGKKAIGVDEPVLLRVKQKALDYRLKSMEEVVVMLLNNDDKKKK